MAAMTTVAHLSESGADLPLVGRTEIFQELLETLGTVRKGNVCSVVLTGPQGSGKTAVLDLFLERCRSSARGVRVLSASGDAWEAQFALAGYSQLMKEPLLRSVRGSDADPAPSAVPATALTPAQVLNYASTLSTHLEGLQSRFTPSLGLRPSDDGQH
jgi:hypothetical protein